MKNILACSLILSMIMFAGCFAPATIKPTTISGKSSTHTNPAKTTQATTRATTRATIATTRATIATTAALGSRTRPAPLGQTMIITTDDYYGKSEVWITLTKVTRGEEAAKLVKKENRFNKIPAGKEVILISVDVQLKKYDPVDDNEDFSIYSWKFDYYDDTMTKIEFSTLVLPEELDAEMFEGGSAKGNIGVLVDKGANVTIRYNDICWYAIK